MNPCISFNVASAMNKLNYVEFVRHLNVGTGDHNTISFAKKKVKSERSVIIMTFYFVIHIFLQC